MGLVENNGVIKLPTPNYEYVTTDERAKQIVADLSRYSVLSIDTEATALDPYEARISLVQVGVPGQAYVFDVRNDLEYSSVDIKTIKPLLTGPEFVRIFQNAAYDMEVVYTNFGFFIDNIYDTMIVEQLFKLGLHAKSSLDYLTKKYLNIVMDKEPRDTFTNYYQKFEPYQLEYAANDVVVLPEIRNCQMPLIKRHGFEDVCRLEFEFIRPLAEMELNGMKLNVDKWRAIMEDVEVNMNKSREKMSAILSPLEDQTTLFGVCLTDLNSPLQLKKALIKYGIPLESTNNQELMKFKGMPIIDMLLDYRKASKLISTYAETLIAKINSKTGRLHTRFKQMVATGRMSSSHPNLQNIPSKQMFRSCFIAEPGYKLITADMSGAELRILGNLSRDRNFIHAYTHGIDLHTKAASEVFGVPLEEVTRDMRGKSKAIQFGIIYGLTKHGLSRRLKISEREAEDLIQNYFSKFTGVKNYLRKVAREAVVKRYSRTVSGRKRFYRLPEPGDPAFVKVKNGIERQGKNAGIQGANADTIKQAMVYVVDRLGRGGYDARLISTVHDEVIVEVKEDQVREVGELVVKCLKDGFGRYFSLIPMESDALVGDCWLKGECEREMSEGKKCGGTEMITVATNDKYKSKVVCKKCGGDI